MIFDSFQGLERCIARGGKNEAIAETCAPLIGRLGVTANPNRNLPTRPRIDTSPVDFVEPAFKCHNGVAPQFAQ